MNRGELLAAEFNYHYSELRKLVPDEKELDKLMNFILDPKNEDTIKELVSKNQMQKH